MLLDFCEFAHENIFARHVRNMWNLFFFTHFSQEICSFSSKSTNSRKSRKNVKMSDSVPSVFDVFPKMSEKSSRVPEWYTSGSWANAFDNTGWQKSPEYALIRIAAGAPDLAKSGQIRPRTAPGAPGKVATFPSGRKSSRIWRQGSLLLPRLKSFPELFFPDHAHRLVRVRQTWFPRRVEFCDRVRHILQMCAHFAKHSLKTAVRAQRHSAHCAHCAQPKPTHVHKLCTPKHRRAHLCTPRTAPTPSPTSRAHYALLLLGKVGGAERPRAINIYNNFIFYLKRVTNFMWFYLCYSRYAKR